MAQVITALCIIMNIDDLKDENVVNALFAIIFVVGLLGFFTYRAYEPVSKSGVVYGEVISYHSGSSGKTAAKPFFKVKLDRGLFVNVPDERILPYTFKGPVVLNRMKRQSTVGYIYTINRKKTTELENSSSTSE